MTVCYQFHQLLKSPVIKYQCLLCQMKAGVFFNEFAIILINNKTFFNKKQRPQSPKERNTDCMCTNLIDFCSHQQSDMNVRYIKYKLESSSMNFQWFWFTTKHFSLTNKDSRAQKRRKMVTICLPIQSITRSTSNQISMFDISNESWSLLQWIFNHFN